LVAAGTVFEPRLDIPAPVGRYASSWLIGDLNLYNRAELERFILVKGINLPTEDLDLVCIYLVLKGQAAISDLVADFSLVYYDPEAGTIILLRDHLGFRPLYWLEQNDILYVSNLPSTLHRIPGLQPTLNVNALARHVIEFGPNDGETYHLEIRRVGPGTALAVDAQSGKHTARRYWEPGIGRMALRSASQALELLDQELTRSILTRLSALDSCGFTLSGGLDSSTIVGVAAQQSHEGHPCFTRVLPDGYTGPAWDERPFVGTMLDRYPQLRPTYVDCSEAPLIAGASESALWHCRPLRYAGFYAVHALDLAAHRQGVRYLFRGGGGDQTISIEARSYLSEAIRKLWLGEAVREARRQRNRGDRATIILARRLIHVLLPERFRARRRLANLRNRVSSYAARSEVIRELESSGAFHGVNRLSPGNAREEMLHYLQELLSGDFFDTDIQLIGLGKVVPTYPLLDWRLLDACLSAPSSTFAGGGQDRRAMRALAEKYATAGIARRVGKGSGLLDLPSRFPGEVGALRKLWQEARKHPLWHALIDDSKLIHQLESLTPDQTPVRRALIPAHLAAFLAQERP
jgi:asparagine synthase (glutamine-hydrolysing)